ncbi:hypothetical protein WA026_006060 [Henosepilachna vigintioctopunctata]|uniref:Uncharacterized protein n=1 Tax=Henosepilachna vigintioctopunctata TaxID=420089 RepID=A0AAW1TNP8_9CUCU
MAIVGKNKFWEVLETSQRLLKWSVNFILKVLKNNCIRFSVGFLRKLFFVHQMKMESLTTGDQYNLKWNSHKICLVNLLEDHLTNEELVDVTLSCSGKYIKAHKLILSASSSYFREIFQVHKVDNPLIILNNVKYEYLKHVIDFIYNGEIRVKDTDLEEILLLGTNLKVKGLSNVTEKHIAQKNNADGKRKDLSDTVGEVKVLKEDKQNQNKPHSERNSKQLEQNNTSLLKANIGSAGPNIGGKVTQVVANQVAQSSVVPKIAVSSEHKTTRNEIDVDSTKRKKRKITVYKPTKDVPQRLMDPLAGDLSDSKLLKEEDREFNCQVVDPMKVTTTKPNQGVVLQVKPVSAFMIFANEWRKRLAVEHPNESNKEISVRLSNMWKNLSDETRDIFYETASRVYADQKQKFKSVKR